MTKRFTLSTTEFDDTLSFYDAECDCETRMSTEYVLDKVEITLNALHEENEQLKHDATVLICSNQEYREKNEQLQNENKQLKQQLRIFEDGLKSEIKQTKITMEDWHECLTDCRKLKEENEQLKEKIKDLHDLLARYEEKMFKNLKE